MLGAKIIREEFKESGIELSAIRLTMDNAEIILVSEGEDRLGTLGVSLPKKDKFVGQPPTSVLLGGRNMILSRMLAERFAEESKKITLVSVFLKTSEREASKAVLNLADKIMKTD